MSLIQEALEKTKRVVETQAPPAPASPQPPAPDPMGDHLEKELTRVQENYAKRRASYRRWGLFGGVCLCAFAVFYFYWTSLSRPPRSVPSKLPAVAAVRRPEIVARQFVPDGLSFHLTGVTDLGGRKVALIDEQIVGVGESLPGGATIKKIERQSVILEMRGKEILLEL